MHDGAGLKDVLEQWGFADLAAGVASRWRCRIAPNADSHEDVVSHVIAGEPVSCSPTHARRVYQHVGDSGGPGGRHFVEHGPWGTFSRPKIAFRGGWVRLTTSLLASSVHCAARRFAHASSHHRLLVECTHGLDNVVHHTVWMLF